MSTSDIRAVRRRREADEDKVTRVSSRPSFLHRFSRHRAGVLGAVVVSFFFAAGLLAPLVAPHDPLEANVLERLQPPSPEHWFGTDEIGRDLLSRLLYGATISMSVSFSVIIVGVTIGVPIGALGAYLGGIFDLVVQRFIDVIQAFPGILLLILITALAGPSLGLAVVALGFLSIPAYSRLIRGTVLLVKQFAYVEAARSIGCRPGRVLLGHILPNAITPVIIQSTLHAANALLVLAGLSFLGLGAQPPTPEWGSMLAQGKIHMRSVPHLLVFPAMAVSLVVLGLNLVGDALRDALDPRAIYGSRR